MSRSYKKNPVVKDKGKNEKRFANKKVRRTKNVPNGGAYKKVYNQYDICDYCWRTCWRTTFEEHMRDRWSWYYRVHNEYGWQWIKKYGEIPDRKKEWKEWKLKFIKK